MNAEFYRKLGKLPGRYWYQMNDKSAAENLQEQRQLLIEKYILSKEEKENIEQQLQENIEKALDDMFSDFQL